MFKNLDSEMAKSGLKRGKLAKAIDMPASTLSEKLNGKYPLTIDECKAIRDVINEQYSLDYLFETEEKKKFVTQPED